MIRVKFSYNKNIAALQTSRESREKALSVYRGFIKNGIFFRPDHDTLLFTELETIYQMFLSNGVTGYFIMRLLTNTLDYEVSRLTGQCARPLTTIEWSAPFLEQFRDRSHMFREDGKAVVER
jgi:hypothetical protein